MSKSERVLVLADIDKVWIDYDRSTDTLHIVFGEKHDEADEAILTESDIGYRIKEGRVIGITIFNFFKRLGLEV